ncbi:hypothetical protein L2E82_10994 [Cichorium intybus]|uniref:Uncharacterized protein n=1 Tax=Cichorium intybus TaxID=13427 RepID=A0ACB9GC06_CICIN|nr:hypothetical protein L2E82_10994 [Cichorium intybus]
MGTVNELLPTTRTKAFQGDKGGFGDKGINIPELDSDQSSSSQNSILTDFGELDDSFIDDSSSRNSSKQYVESQIPRYGDVRGWMCSDRQIDSIAEVDGIGSGGGSDSPSSSDGKKTELVKYAQLN